MITPLHQLRQGDGSVILSAYRLQAAGEAGEGSTTGLAAYRAAYRTVSDGHRAVHGDVSAIITDTVVSSPRDNGLQNAGSTADKLGDERGPARPIELPL